MANEQSIERLYVENQIKVLEAKLMELRIEQARWIEIERNAKKKRLQLLLDDKKENIGVIFWRRFIFTGSKAFDHAKWYWSMSPAPAAFFEAKKNTCV
jgi:hypothetical protein